MFEATKVRVQDARFNKFTVILSVEASKLVTTVVHGLVSVYVIGQVESLDLKIETSVIVYVGIVVLYILKIFDIDPV